MHPSAVKQSQKLRDDKGASPSESAIKEFDGAAAFSELEITAQDARLMGSVAWEPGDFHKRDR